MKNISIYDFILYFLMCFLISLVSFIVKSCEVKAESFTPGTLEAFTTVSSSRATGNLNYFMYGLDYYSSNLSEAYGLYGLYAVTNNTTPGNYFSFFALSLAPSTTGYLQLSDSSYVSCNPANSSVVDGWNVYAFTCNLPNNVTVYKYGITVSNAVPSPNIKISKLTYFADASSSQINEIQSSISSVFNNISNVANNVKDVENAVKDTNDTMKDDNIDTSSSNSFFNNFSNNQHGLTGVINAPLKFIQSLSNNTCSNVSLTIPFVNETFNLPCFSSIYKENFNLAYTIYQVVISALVGYWVCVKIYAMVKGFKDPTDDRIEVMDL